jgi:hypothetical protein
MHQQLWGYKVELKSVSRGTGGKKVEYHCSTPPLCPDRLWVSPASYPVGTTATSLGVKRPEREADHSRLLSRLIMRGDIPPVPHTSSWRGTHLCRGTSLSWYGVNAVDVYPRDISLTEVIFGVF